MDMLGKIISKRILGYNESNFTVYVESAQHRQQTIIKSIQLDLGLVIYFLQSLLIKQRQLQTIKGIVDFSLIHGT